MRKKAPAIALVLALLLVLSAAPGATQAPVAQTPTVTAVAVSRAFTYQGQLIKAGDAVDATCEMRFTLYDAPAGNPIGPVINTSVAVAQGLFTVPLDFGELVFQGDARWIEVLVKCPGDADFTPLAPRQALTATPYALSLRPGASVSGTVVNGAALSVKNHDTAGDYGHGLMGSTMSHTGIAVFGNAFATSGVNYGVYGSTGSDSGYGVFGLAQSTSGATYGVYGRTQSSGGYGVYGDATSSTNGKGVHGVAPRYGVSGHATTTDGPSTGVTGHTESNAGSGVYGYADSDTGTTYGMQGIADSTAGYGVSGYASATSGTTYGVYGKAASTAGYGVSGHASATSGTTYGVYGKSDSPTGRAIAGHATATAGVNYGVLGRTSSPDGYGVYAAGDFGASGTKSAVVSTKAFGVRRLYAMESPAVLFEDVGTARLVDGLAVVPIDPIFAETVNLQEPYQVFVTGQGEGPVLLWVSERSAASFTVRGVTLDGKPARGAFDYRIIARRLGYEDVRLRPAVDPAATSAAEVPADATH